MGHRLSAIVTKTGDNGTTGLADGSRCPKCDVRIEAIGDLDELNCVVGLVLKDCLQRINNQSLFSFLQSIQNKLFDIGGEIAMGTIKAPVITEEDVIKIEEVIEEYNKDLPPLKNFILPSGNTHSHLARAVARRVERRLVELNQVYPDLINQYSLQYINRLSDYFFVVSRFIDRVMFNKGESMWQQRKTGW